MTTEITINIKANSRLGQFIIKRMAEKKAFREATAGLTFDEYVEYCKKNNIRFDAVIDPSLL
jgi:hypothetical protein